MKLKGINPIEQHVDKVVLGGAAAALLAVIALQFTTQPNLVQPDPKGDKIPPERAFEPAEQAANRLLGQLQAPPQLPEVPALTLVEGFERNTGRPLIESPVAVALGVPPRIGGGAIAPVTDGRFAALQIPAPASPVAAVFEGALDPATVLQYPELKQRELVPQQQPYDKASVSVEATYSGAALRAALEADPDGPDGELRPIPMAWWRDGVEILAVQLERSSLTTDGTWSEPVLVEAMPGRLNLLAELAAAPRVTIGMLRSMIDQARAYALDVQRPDFYPYLVGEAWIPPSDAIRRQELEERQAKIDRINEQLAELDAQIASLQGEVDRAPERIVREPVDTDTGGGGGGGKGAGGGGGREPSRQPAGDRPKPQQTKAQLTRQLEQVRRERDNRARELAALGVAPANDPGATTTSPTTRPLGPATLVDAGEIKVWSHDITAQRGMTYRYRLRVVLNNPYYGNALSLPEDQKPLAEQPTIASGWTDWSSPVAIDPPQAFFVTAAAVADEFGGTRASASVYEFYYGYWRAGNASLSPGDPVEARLRLPAPELMPIFNESQLAAAVPTERSGFRPLEDDGGTTGGKRGAGTFTPDPASAASSQPVLPTNSTPGPRDRSVMLETVYLSTARMPVAAQASIPGAAAGDRFQVFMRDGDGDVFTRVPHDDRTNQTFRRMERSAKLGERQGAPAPPKPERPKPPVERERPGSGRTPSGGGTGGG